MSERPILFSAPMVRAILDGTKTQTRRVVKLPVEGEWDRAAIALSPTPLRPMPVWSFRDSLHGEALETCPYGLPGDRLWVREAWAVPHRWRGEKPADLVRYDGAMFCPVFYAADGEPPEPLDRWRPSIHMPRAASRLTLEVTEVRVERVQDITFADALAEGCRSLSLRDDVPESDRPEFRSLWESINGPRGYGWEANPWVWALSFRVVAPEVAATDG